MASELLLDTGGLISLLDRRQPGHAAFREAFERFEGTVVGTEAVLTEASHLLSRAPGGREAAVEFFAAGGAVLVPSSAASLRRCLELMRRYRDLPMDYADATLVVLAEELRTDLVLTTDRRDFGVYRIAGRRKFRILPERGHAR